MNNLFVVVLLMVGLSSFAVADASKEAASCANLSFTQEMLECSTAEKVKSDTALNNEYRKLRDRTAEQYKLDPTSRDIIQKRILMSQRNWIGLRDTNCELEANDIEVGVIAYEISINLCVAKMSTERAEYLKLLIP